MAGLKIYAQTECLCKELSDEIIYPRDSLAVFQKAGQLINLQNDACVFEMLSLKFNYYNLQKNITESGTILELQKEFLKHSECRTHNLHYNLNKAKYYHSLNDFEQLSVYAISALKLSEDQLDTNTEIEVLKELVWLYTRMNENEKAWIYVKRAEALINSQNTANIFHRVENLIWLGYQYETHYTHTNNKNLIEISWNYITKAQPVAKSNLWHYELTQIYRAKEALSYHKEELEKALEYIDSAIYYGKKIKGEKNLSGLYLSKAWDHLDLKQYEKAGIYTDSMLYFDTKEDIAGYMMTESQAAELYEKSGHPLKALQSQKQYSKLKDSILTTERVKTINELETKYQSEVKDARIKKLVIAVIVLILLLVLVVLILKINELKKLNRKNKALELAYENRLKLEKELNDVRDEIAKDFHDDLGNKLARISLLSNLVSGEVSIDDPNVKSKIKQITEDANGLYRGTRDFIFSLKSNSDYLEEMIDYLSDFGNDYFGKANIDFRVSRSIDTNVKLPYYWSKQLIFIFKEAFTNILKHSKCEKVFLNFKLKNDVLTVECIDDGAGIPENKRNSNSGLEHMASRAKKIKGQLNIISKTDSGTTICFTGNLNQDF